MNETTGSLSWADVLAAVPESAPTSTATMKVNHDNVLAAAKIIQTQIDALTDAIRLNGPSLIIEPTADDPVSVDAANAWNHRLVGADDSYAARIGDYLQSLNLLIKQLRDSAKTYGFNEQDIEAAFGGTSGA
ncbi:hypothetical protein DMH04_46835 [Kibdelosporangium aridum]|uniref:PE domain-containing protein n=1 Tax=Kibdelosporangium aridum TaxID=2030 RepID=A0A428YMB6_KIBAR|nr:hypothetical protein [Kibdelosporangium aridum]RSM68903.1 hypothetical protein DMH04_46835 [Kibdelosporangium aridum]